MIEEQQKTSEVERKYSNWIIASFASVVIIQEMYNIIFGTYVFFFYETEVKLGLVFLTMAYIFYAIWNMFNDPLVGNLADRPNRLWKRWGKRFPFIAIAIIPWVVSWGFIFTPPDVDTITGALTIFLWFLTFTCLYDLFYSIVSTNTSALLPDKFRLDDDRRKYSALRTFLGFVGTMVGSLIPPMFINYGVKSSYAQASGIVIIIGVIVTILFLPGAREDKSLRERYFEESTQQEEKISFISSMKSVLKQKNYMVVILVYLMSDTAGACLTASLNYVLRYVLNEPADALLLLMIFFLLGSFVSVPVWLKLSQKMENNRKLLLTAGISNVIILASVAFFPTYLSMMFAAFFLGFAMAGFKVGIVPCITDSMDENLVTNQKHMEGSSIGILVFFLRFSLILQALIFTTVHVITGFNPDLLAQPESAILGIRFHFGLIPAILFIASILFFYKFYDLTPEKTSRIKDQMKELKL